MRNNHTEVYFGSDQVRDERVKHLSGNTHRIQESLSSNAEKRLLIFLAERLPNTIQPDHLTALGFIAQVLTGLSYALARKDRYWLLAGIGFLGMNWLCDSLDGTLARVRKQERPRYGFYVDHMIDSLGAVFLMAGLALSGFMHPYIAIGLLIAFLLLSIQSYLAAQTLGEFRLSFWCFGPTELRALLAMGNLALLHWPRVLPQQFRLFDIGGVIGLAGMLLMLLVFTARNACRLYQQERV